MTAAANLQPMGGGGEGGAAAADLSRAAKSLESVQGGVSGQTQAIQQMTMAGQQQMSNMQMLITSLGNQVSSLMQAVGQLSNNVRMGSMPGMGSMAQPMAGPSMAPMGGGMNLGGMMAGAGGMAAQGGMMAGGALQTAGGAFGRMGAGAVSPFLGSGIHGPQAGMYGPQLGGDASFGRSMGMAAGIGIQPDMMRQAGGAQIQALGRENMQQRFQGSALAGIGGMGRLGTIIGGEAAGGMAMSAMGVGGIAGMAGGMALGMPLAAAGGMAIDEVMGQTASIRGSGDQFARNAFRHMGPSGGAGGALRRPGMRQRQQFGQAMNKTGIEDLTFDQGDMREMFAGMSQQDLMRGAGSVEEVVKKFRETKEVFKQIGRRMGQGIQEASETMGALQGIGMDPTGSQGRAAIFGASSVVGQTPTEAMNASASMGQRFAGRGIGGAMMRQQQAGSSGARTLMNSGVLNNRDVAALGGEQATRDSTTNFMEAFMNSSIGKATLLAGSESQGLGARGTMKMAGRRASGDINKLVELQMGGQGMMDDFAKDEYGSRISMMNKVKELASTFERPGVSKTNAMKMAIKHIGEQGGMQVNDIQAGALLKQFENMPAGIKERAIMQMQEASNSAQDSAFEQTSIMARGKRGFGRALEPVAAGLASGTLAGGASLNRLTEGIEQAMTGREVVDIGKGMDVGVLEGLKSKGGKRTANEGMLSELGADSGLPMRDRQVANKGIRRENASRKERNAVRAEQSLVDTATPSPRLKANFARKVAGMKIANSKRIDELKTVLNDPGSSSGQKRKAMKEAMSLLSDGMYDQANGIKGGENVKKAIQDAVSTAMGVDPSAILMGNETAAGLSFSKSERAELSDLRGEISEVIGDGTEASAAAFASPEIGALVTALDTGSGIVEAEAAAKAAGFGTQAKEVIDLKQSGERQLFHSATKFDELASMTGDTKAGKKLRSLQAKQSTDARMQMVGKSASAMITGLRQKGLGKGMSTLDLGGQDADSTAAGLGAMVSGASEKDIEALAGGTAGEQRMAGVMKELQGIQFDGDLTRAEKTKLAKLAGHGLNADSPFLQGLQQKDIGKVAALALDQEAAAGAGAAGITSTGKGGITAEQSKFYNEMNENLRKTTEMLTALSKNDLFK
jgi:hypothetical protein